MTFYLTGVLFVLICCYGGLYAQRRGPSALTLNDEPEISDSIPFECWNFTYGDPTNMEFYSPNFPGNYPNNVNCARYIEAPPGYIIHLDFREHFDIEKSDKCTFDYLAVHDGPFSYSPRIEKLCGDEFPSKIIKSSTRYMWLQFVSDKNLGQKGFKATYSFNTKKDYNEQEEEREVCRIHYNKIGQEGSVTTDRIPLSDTKSPGYPVNRKIDCTWEIDAPPNTKVGLTEISSYFTNSGDCKLNKVEIYDGTTLPIDRRLQDCGHGPLDRFETKTNKMFFRVYSINLSTKPTISFLFTKFIANDTCNESYFSCDGRCIIKSQVCNGKKNCPGGLDEKTCDVTDSKTVALGVESLPLMAIIIGAVGGVLGTIIVIGVCLFCFYKNRKRRKQREQQIQRDKAKENVEMSAISANTTLISKKGGQPNYFSLPRQHRGGGPRDYVRRDSVTNSSAPSEGDVPDHNSDPGNYKKYLMMDQYLDEETSPCPSVYSQGPVLTTIIERHDIPPQTRPEIDGSYGWTGYGWKQPHQGEMKPPMSLTENIAKLAQYNIPQKTFNPDYKMYAPDPKYEMYPELRYNIGKDYTKLKYVTQNPEITTPTKEQQKSFKMASPHPDITRDLEVT